jgi:hypothetical protein
MAKPMRSFTLRIGLNASSLTNTSADDFSGSLFRRTSGVWPIVSRIFAQILGLSAINHPFSSPYQERLKKPLKNVV